MANNKKEKVAIVLPTIVRLPKGIKTMLNMSKARGTYAPSIKAAFVDSTAWRSVTERLILGGKRAETTE